MNTEYRFDTLADIAALFEERAKSNAESAEHAGTKLRASTLREAANTWRAAADIIRNATVKQEQV